MRKACCGEGSGVLHAAPRASGVVVAVTRTGTCRHLAIHRRLSAVAAALRSFIRSASVRRRTLVITTGRPSPGRSQTVVSTPPVCCMDCLASYTESQHHTVRRLYPGLPSRRADPTTAICLPVSNHNCQRSRLFSVRGFTGYSCR